MQTNQGNGPIPRQIGFDPATGKPIYEWVMQTGYDPMTGQPVYERVVQNGFDPMTGKPVYVLESMLNRVQPNPAVGGAPVKKQAKRRNWKPVIIVSIIAAVVLVCGGVGYALIKSGVFLDKYDKILYAAYNTVEKDRVLGTLTDTISVLESDSISMEGKVDVGADGESFGGNVTLGMDRSAGELRADGTMTYNGISADASGYLDKDKMQISIPELSKKVYQLSFSGSQNGYITQELQDEMGMGLQDMSKIIQEAFQTTSGKSEDTLGLLKSLRARYKKMQIREAGSKTVTIGEGTHSAKGYTLVITKQDLVDMTKITLDGLKRSVDKESFKELWKAQYGRYGMSEEELEQYYERYMYQEFDRALEEISRVRDFTAEIQIYLYDNQIAEISWDDGRGDGITLELTGGDGVLASNFNLFVVFAKRSGYTVARTSEYKDGTESGRLYAKGHVQEFDFSYSYNTRDGEFYCGLPERLSYDGVDSFGGTWKTSSRELEFAMNLYVEDASIDLSVKLTKGANTKALSGDVFELASKSEMELMTEAQKLQMQPLYRDLFEQDDY